MKTYDCESEAFAAIAKRLQKAGEMPLYTAWSCSGSDNKCQGLCHVLDNMQHDGEISKKLAQQMGQRIREHIDIQNLKANGVEFRKLRSVYLCTPGLVEPRIIAAQLLALEAAEDEIKFVGEAVRIGLDEAEDYVPRTNAVPEGATVDEWESGSGGDGFDEDDDDERDDGRWFSVADDDDDLDDDEDDYRLGRWTSVDEIVDEDEELPW